MKAAQANSYGGQAVVTVNEAAKPPPQAGHVLVEVQAASINPFDVYVREGHAKNWVKHDFPLTLGGDAAGTVVELGEGIEGFEIGQAVYGLANAVGGEGSFAEFTAVKAEQLANKPNSVDFTQAAALPLAATSAYQALVDHANLQPGQKVLIHGGAGGIGSFAIQIAKNIGAYVATTTGSKDLDFVKQLGADEAIDYQTQDFSTIIKDYDVVFDTVGGETNVKSYLVLKAGGTFVSMTSPPAEEQVKAKNINYIEQQSRATTERLTAVAELVDQGVIKINIDKVFPLSQAAEALEYLKAGHPRGKVVLQIK